MRTFTLETFSGDFKAEISITANFLVQLALMVHRSFLSFTPY